MPDIMKRYLVFGWEAHEQRGGFHDFLRDFSSRDEAYLYAKAAKESHKIDEYQIYDTYSGQILSESIFKYDANGNLIYAKYRDGEEYWYEYNANNILIHSKNNSGSKYWFNSHGKKLDHPPQEKEDTNT